MQVEDWLKYGGKQPSTETIQLGFIILYNHVYQTDGVRDFWNLGYCFTDDQKQRWGVLEQIAGLKPIMAKYEIVCEERRNNFQRLMEKEKESN